MIFLDLRNREEERSKVKKTRDEYKHKKDAGDKRQEAKAEKCSDEELEKLQNGKTKRVLAKFFQVIKNALEVYFQTATKAMEQRRMSILREKEKHESKAEKNSQKRAREETKRRDKEINNNNSARLIEAAKKLWLEHCNEISKLGTDNTRACDVFDVCAVAFFRNVCPNLSLLQMLHLVPSFDTPLSIPFL